MDQQRKRVHARLILLKSERFSNSVTAERKAELDKGIVVCEAALAIGAACDSAVEHLEKINASRNV